MLGNKEVLNISIEDILPNRFQPRLAFGEKELNELADSIKQHGIIQPLLLRKIGDKFEIIAGERRYKAASLAGLNNVPAIVVETDDNTSAEIAIIENIQRKDLTPIEEAQSYKKLIEKGNTQEGIAKKLGIAQSTIANKLRLLSLPEAVQDALLNNKISERHARSLLSITDEQAQLELLNRIVAEKLTVKQTDEIINDLTNKSDNIEQLQVLTPEIETLITEINPLKEEIFEINDPEIEILSPFSEEAETFDALSPNTEAQIIYEEPKDEIIEKKEEKPINGFISLINKTRDFTSSLENEGLEVTTDEFDFDDIYQIVIKIKKSE